MRQYFWQWALAAVALSGSVVGAADQLGPDAAALKAARDKGVAFLKTSQNEDGSWTSSEAPGVTGLVTFGLLAGGATADDPAVAKALKHLESFVQPTGGIYFAKSNHAIYETGISMMVFAAVNKDGKYDKLLANADKYVRGLQWDESEKTDKSDPKYGGIGYGRSGDRPDLSNTVFFLEALQAAGAKKDDPAVQKALVFLSRCQNLETEHNNTAFASKINDGGFYYTPAAGGTSQAGNNPDGGLRSYGSMTYAGLKSMVFAGLTPDDQRVQAALTWIKKFYTVKENPGLGEQGVYYYHQMFSKALTIMKADLFEDANGKKHDWRKELAEHLFSVQKDNGSWVNSNPRWMEGDPNLATAYVLMALKNCDPKPAK
ncbi:MAG TPA: prenyltransferase/squalene oxidase repeat-containing protein [Planctomycetaceae bacterium]|nr:prenyltransferase/squalene oxidase repeat-containing protein [Planctomycetaceae bacterium]